MSRKLAALDTSVLILMLTEKENDTDEEQDRELRRLAVREALSTLQVSHRFFIPAPALAELAEHGGAAVAMQTIVKRLGRMRVEPLDFAAAAVAAEMAHRALSQRKGRERGAVKYDVLIAAICHKVGADQLLTEDEKNTFTTALEVVNSQVSVVVPSRPPEKGQVTLLQAARRRKK